MGKVDDWIKWLEAVNLDVRDLLFARQVYRRVGEIVDANPRIQRPSHYYDFLQRVYASHVAMGVRRQVDEGRDTQSLRRLLRDIAGKPEFLNRKRYVDLVVDSAKGPGATERARLRADQEFDERHGAGAQHFRSQHAREDEEGLIKIAERVKAHVDSHLAHLGRERPEQQPATFDELDECLDALEKLVAKYMLELRAVTYQPEPVLVGPWLEIFRVPWIDDDG